MLRQGRRPSITVCPEATLVLVNAILVVYGTFADILVLAGILLEGGFIIDYMRRNVWNWLFDLV